MILDVLRIDFDREFFRSRERFESPAPLIPLSNSIQADQTVSQRIFPEVDS